jgi:hypothetical protein
MTINNPQTNISTEVLKHHGAPVTHYVIVLIKGSNYAHILFRKANGEYFHNGSINACESQETIESIARILIRGFDVPVVNLGIFDTNTWEFISESVDSLFWEEREGIWRAFTHES